MKKRNKLKEYLGQRKSYTGFFNRYSFKKNDSNGEPRYILLVDLKNENGDIFDHVWISNEGLLSKYKFIEDDFIHFDADVCEYTKLTKEAKKAYSENASRIYTDRCANDLELDRVKDYGLTKISGEEIQYINKDNNNRIIYNK